MAKHPHCKELKVANHRSWSYADLARCRMCRTLVHQRFPLWRSIWSIASMVIMPTSSSRPSLWSRHWPTGDCFSCLLLVFVSCLLYLMFMFFAERLMSLMSSWSVSWCHSCQDSALSASLPQSAWWAGISPRGLRLYWPAVAHVWWCSLVWNVEADGRKGDWRGKKV